jgi:hypothetical protein
MPASGTCTNEQQIPVTVAPASAQGNPAPVQGALRVEVVSGDGTFTQDPVTPLMFKAVSGSAMGDTVYNVRADADLGEGEELIEDQYTLTVTGAKAASFGMTSGVAEPKPAVNPQRARR